MPKAQKFPNYGVNEPSNLIWSTLVKTGQYSLSDEEKSRLKEINAKFMEMIQLRDDVLLEKDSQLKQNDEKLLDIYGLVKDTYGQLKHKDEQLSQKDDQLHEKDEQLTEKDGQLQKKIINLFNHAKP